jgi:hypothetical protein
VVVVVQEVFELDIVIPYVGMTTNKCHTNTKNSKGAIALWSNKFTKLVSGALAHNANVA